MKKLFKRMGIAVAILLNGAINASAQTVTDVTSTYLTNAALTSTTGWTRTGSWDDTNISNGVTEVYGGWDSNTNNSYSCKQTVTLPKGVYKLTGYAFYRSQATYSTDADVSLAYLVAGDVQRQIMSLSVPSRDSYPNSRSDAATAFYTDGDYLNTLYFTVAEDGTAVSIGYEGTHNSSQSKSWFIAGAMKLYKIDIASVSSSTPLDIDVINAGFDICVNGWAYTTGAPNHGRATNQSGDISGGYFENWKWESYTGVIHQSQNLPNGSYTVKAAAFRDQLITNASDGDAVYVFANNDQTLVSAATGTYYSVSTNVTTGTLDYGVKSTVAKYRWMGIDNTTIKCNGLQLAYADNLPATEVTSNHWHAVTIPTTDDYEITSTAGVTMTYTQDGAQLACSATGTDETFTAGQTKTINLSAGTVYIKTSAASTISVSYKYNVGTATSSHAYVQGGETVTISWAGASTNDPGASFGKNGDPTITFGGNPVSVTPTSNGFTFTVPTVTAGTSYTLSIPVNAFGYAAGDTYNTAQNITIKAPEIFDGTYFFKDDNDKFWLRGEPYGSAVQVYDWGMPVNVTTDAMGATTLHFADASDWKIFSDGTGIFADNASHANSTWSIIKSGTKYFFKNAVNNHYMKVDGTRILSTATEGEATAFTLVTPAHHQNVLTAYVNAQASTAATAAGLSASTPAELQTAADGINATTVIGGTTAATTAEKWQGGQWDSRTVYSNTVSVSTPGLYKFTLQGFYRMTDNDATYALHTAQADCPPVYVFFGDAKTPIKSVMDESRASAYEGNNNDYANVGNHYPNQQASSLVAFQEGKYVNTVWAYIAEAGEYTYGIQYLGWAGSHSEWTCYTTESISLSLYTEDLWPALQSALATYATYNDVAEGDDATGYTTAYNTYAAYTAETAQSSMATAIAYMETNYSAYQWAHASIAHPVDVTVGIISGWECTANDAWPGSGRSTATGTYYDGSNRTYFTQNHEDGAARSQDVTIPEIGAYLLRTIVRPVADASYATITIGSESTTTRGRQTGTANIGNNWAYNDIYFATTTANASKTISINLSNVNNSREADCGEMHLYYIGQNADFVKEGIHSYIGTYANAPAITLTDEVPVADISKATYTSGTSAVTFTNPNGLVFANAGQTSADHNVIVNNVCASLQLTSGHPFVNPNEFTATNAQYNLANAYLAGGEYATLVIPFNATTLPGTAYALNQGVDVMGGTMRGTTVSSITANQPVLVTASGNYTGSGVTVPVVSNGTTYTNGELVGVYQSTQAPEGSYVLQNHTGGEGVAFYIVGSTKPTVNPFRAYIKSQTAGARALFFLMEEEITGINTISNEESVTGKAEAYDLQGRRTKNLKRGMYIINGKKIIIK